MDEGVYDSSNIHLHQQQMNSYFRSRVLDKDFQFPLQKDDDLMLFSLQELNSLNANSQTQGERNLSRQFELDLNDIKDEGHGSFSPSGSMKKNQQNQQLQQGDKLKSIDLKYSQNGADETFQNSQIGILKQHLHSKERIFEDKLQNKKEKQKIEERQKKQSAHTSVTKPNKSLSEAENHNYTTQVRFEDQVQDGENEIGKQQLKKMIFQNKVSNLKKKFVNALIRTSSSAIFRNLTRKQFSLLNDASSDIGYFLHKQQLIFSEVIYENGEPITNRIKICQKYFWNFIKDVIIAVLYQYSKTLSRDDTIKYLDFIVFIKYINIPSKLQELETKLQISQSYMNWLKLIKLECLVLLIAHVACCIFLRIGLTEMYEDKASWLTQFKHDQNNLTTNYIISLYYIIITMTTIGYGDITPYTMVEKVCMIIVALIATNICAYSYSQINEIVKYEEQKKHNYDLMMNGINNEMNKIGVNVLLQHKVRKYFEFQQYKEQQKQLTSESLLDILPVSLKEEVLRELTAGLSDEIQILKILSHECKKQITLCIKQKVFFPDQVIIKENELNDSLYYIAQGSVTMSIPVKIQRDDGQSIPYMNIKTLTKKQVFGYESFLLDQVNPHTVKSDGVGFLLILQKDELLNILKRFPHDYEKYSAMKDDAILNRKTDHLLFPCISCSDNNHQQNRCPYVNMIRRRIKPSQQQLQRQKIIRNEKKQKIQTLKELNNLQMIGKEFVLQQQKEEIIKELYYVLNDQRQADREDTISEDTNSDSEQSQEQNEETSSVIVSPSDINYPPKKLLDSKNDTRSMHNKKRTSKGNIQNLEISTNNQESRVYKDVLEKNQHPLPLADHQIDQIKTKQLYVIEEGEEDTQQYTLINRSTEFNQNIFSNLEVEDKVVEIKNTNDSNKQQMHRNVNNLSAFSNFGESINGQLQYQELSNPYKGTSNQIADFDNLAESISHNLSRNQSIEDNLQQQKALQQIQTSPSQNVQQFNSNTSIEKQKKTTRGRNSNLRNSVSILIDQNKVNNELQSDECCDVKEEDAINKVNDYKESQFKNISFIDQIYEIQQKKSKKILREERKLSQILNNEAESPLRYNQFSSQLIEDFLSPTLRSPYRKGKKIATIIAEKQGWNEAQTHSSSAILPMSNGNLGSGSQIQTNQNIQFANQINGSQYNLPSPTITTSVSKRNSTKQLSILQKNSQRQLNYFGNMANNTIPSHQINNPYQNNVYSQQADFETQTSTKLKETKRNSLQSFTKMLQNNQIQFVTSNSKHNDIHRQSSLSPSVANGNESRQQMYQSNSNTQEPTYQNLNAILSQNRIQTQIMNSSVEGEHKYSSEYQIKYKEGLLDLDMLIVRKNMRRMQEMGLLRHNVVRVQDNEIDIDIMRNWHFYFPESNPKVIIYKIIKQEEERAKKYKQTNKQNYSNKVRKSRQSEYSSFSNKNLSTKNNSNSNNPTSRPSLKL